MSWISRFCLFPNIGPAHKKQRSERVNGLMIVWLIEPFCCSATITSFNFCFSSSPPSSSQRLIDQVPATLSKHNNSAGDPAFQYVKRRFVRFENERKKNGWGEALRTVETNAVTWDHQRLVQSGWRCSGDERASRGKPAGRTGRTDLYYYLYCLYIFFLFLITHRNVGPKSLVLGQF